MKKWKKMNSGLLELIVGILFLGILCQIIGVFLAKEAILYSIALWIGVLLALVTVLHMYRMLDKALELGENSRRAVTLANVSRYFCTVAVFGVVWFMGLNPLVTFLGLMTLKVAAYLQPLTHKVCNRIFRR